MASVASMVAAGEADGSRKTYDFNCAVLHAGGLCGWQSTGWPTKAIATARGEEHIEEHKTAANPDVETKLTSTLAQFRSKHGLTDEGKLPEGAVRLEDL